MEVSYLEQSEKWVVAEGGVRLRGTEYRCFTAHRREDKNKNSKAVTLIR